jgi:hypothetical protein
VVVTEPDEVKADLLSRVLKRVDFKSIDINATGGTGPYTYSADNITYSTVPFVSSISFDVPVGTYRYFVKISMVVFHKFLEILRYYRLKH